MLHYFYNAQIGMKGNKNNNIDVRIANEQTKCNENAYSEFSTNDIKQKQKQEKKKTQNHIVTDIRWCCWWVKMVWQK